MDELCDSLQSQFLWCGEENHDALVSGLSKTKEYIKAGASASAECMLHISGIKHRYMIYLRSIQDWEDADFLIDKMNMFCSTSFSQQNCPVLLLVSYFVDTEIINRLKNELESDEGH